MIFIPIDADTVQYNPNRFGGIVEVAPVSVDMTISGFFRNKKQLELCMSKRPFIDEDNIKIFMACFSSDIKEKFSAQVWIREFSEEIINRLKKEFRDLNFKISYNHHEIQTLPGPEFLYSYKDIKFDCPHCDFQNITRSELKTIDSINEDGDDVSHDVCPNCSEEIKFTFEKFSNDKLKRLAKDRDGNNDTRTKEKL